VLGTDIARDDIDTSLHSIRLLSGFAIQHELAFQAVDGGPGIRNGDLYLQDRSPARSGRLPRP
jgi:hypothetical protein